MSWCPFATRMELQPESDAQPAINPTQLIFHSIAAPWTPGHIYEYWRDSTNLESHFGLGYDGSLAQFIGTQTRADANYLANRRPDGTGAISLESASNLNHTDPWTDAQIATLIRLGVWAHQQHGIPLRICRTADDPGFGYHRLHAAWSTGGTACPGDARVAQFKSVVFPGIVARATGTQEEDMPLTSDDVKKVWGYSNGDTPDVHQTVADAASSAAAANTAVKGLGTKVDSLSSKLDTLAAKVGSLETTGLTAEQITAIANAVADVQAKRLES
ncbi:MULTISPECIES: N-acetylmuramoyl-L-alanine amidase [unclassified Streptomyces]|uniref:N-acetylmuramoyl-L-alanine amidase n=1 Tax=unclassified Streptomyces TaxID=2593676 RepID=UPI0034050157